MHLVKARQLFTGEGRSDEELLWQLYWEEGRQDVHRCQLVDLYTPFTRKISLSLAIKFRNLGVAPEDCSQNGMVGLLEAIERFNPGRTQFKTYAAYRIRGAVLNGITHYNEQLDLLAFRRESEKDRVASLLENRDPNADGFDQIVDATLDLAISVLMDEMMEEEEMEQTDSPYPTSEGYLLSRRLFDLAMALPERESMLIFYHYFLGYRFKEIATLMDISRSRTSQLHARALRLVREKYLGVKRLEFNA